MAEFNTNPPIPVGWQCPLCGTVYNPTIKSCGCKAKVVPDEGEKGSAKLPFGIKIDPAVVPIPPKSPWFPNDPSKKPYSYGGGQMPTSPPPTPYAKWDPVRQVWLKGCPNSMCNCTGRCNQPVGSPDFSSLSWSMTASEFQPKPPPVYKEKGEYGIGEPVPMDHPARKSDRPTAPDCTCECPVTMRCACGWH